MSSLPPPGGHNPWSLPTSPRVITLYRVPSHAARRRLPSDPGPPLHSLPPIQRPVIPRLAIPLAPLSPPGTASLEALDRRFTGGHAATAAAGGTSSGGTTSGAATTSSGGAATSSGTTSLAATRGVNAAAASAAAGGAAALDLPDADGNEVLQVGHGWMCTSTGVGKCGLLIACERWAMSEMHVRCVSARAWVSMWYGLVCLPQMATKCCKRAPLSAYFRSVTVTCRKACQPLLMFHCGHLQSARTTGCPCTVGPTTPPGP